MQSTGSGTRGYPLLLSHLERRIMNYSFLFDLLLFAFFEASARACVREAYSFRRNKRQIKERIKNLALVRRVFRLYFPGETNAPNNMRLFQLFRAVNCLGLLVNCYFVWNEKAAICGGVLCAKIVLLYLPFIIYVVYALLKGPAGHKNIDYSIFRNP